MNLSFYTAAVGAQQQQDRLDVHGNNIANVNTYGFRARIPEFSVLMMDLIPAIDRDVRRGVGSRMIDAETDFRTTGVTGTGRALDFAIDGDGFFAVMDPATGEISYTRDGSFTMSDYPMQGEAGKEWEAQDQTTWRLTDGNGRFVLGTNGAPIDITLTGTTDLFDLDLDVGVFDFINRNGMLSLNDNRHTPIAKNGQVTMGSGKLIRGYLELSNADLANEMVKVIESQRSFQYMLRMVTTSDEIESTVNSLRS